MINSAIKLFCPRQTMYLGKVLASYHYENLTFLLPSLKFRNTEGY